MGTDTTHLLVDTGISGKRTEAGLNELELSLSDVDGILITHEHADHINGLGVVSRKYGIPIYATGKTIEAMKNTKSLGSIDDSLFKEVYPDEKLTIKDMVVHPMKVSHDAAEPVAYRFYHGSKKMGVITDLGCFDDYTVARLAGLGCDFNRSQS